MNLTKYVQFDFTAEETVISEKSQDWCSVLLCLFVLRLLFMLASSQKVAFSHFLLFVAQFEGFIISGAFPDPLMCFPDIL